MISRITLGIPGGVYHPTNGPWFRTGAPCSPQRTPGFPVKFPGVDELHAAFLDESRTRIRWWRLVQEIRDHGPKTDFSNAFTPSARALAPGSRVFTRPTETAERAAPHLFRPMYAEANMGHPSREQAWFFAPAVASTMNYPLCMFRRLHLRHPAILPRARRAKRPCTNRNAKDPVQVCLDWDDRSNSVVKRKRKRRGYQRSRGRRDMSRAPGQPHRTQTGKCSGALKEIPTIDHVCRLVVRVELQQTWSR